MATIIHLGLSMLQNSMAKFSLLRKLFFVTGNCYQNSAYLNNTAKPSGDIVDDGRSNMGGRKHLLIG